MNIFVTVEEGAGRGRSFEFAQPDIFLIGRSTDAHLIINPDDTAVSRRHCLLEVAPPRCYVRDLGSTNGTFLNGVKVSQAEIKHGDALAIGRTTLRITIVDEARTGTNCQLCAGPSPTPICQTCREDNLKPIFPISANRSFSGKAPCLECDCPLGDVANRDGLAGVYQDAATYLCPACAEKVHNLPKERICGEYRLLRQIGAGGMGVVFLAWDPRTCRVGALKRISLPFPDDLTVQRFLRETRIMAGIVHPNIVRLYRQGFQQGVPFLVSEFLTEGSLSDQMRDAGGRLPIGKACRWVSQLLSGLVSFHRSGHVHRDIKPGNILLQRLSNGTGELAKLADFGLAKSFSAAGGTVLTQANHTGGSLQYMPPEQIASFKTAGPPADIYALGISLYQMITGVLPFAEAMKSASSNKDILIILLEEKPSPIRSLNPDIPEELAEIIDSTFKKNPAQRIETDEFQEALTSFLSRWKDQA